LKDLVQKDVDVATQEILVQRQIQLSSGKRQCAAMNHAKNPAFCNQEGGEFVWLSLQTTG
jgi:hypothetical protein